MHDYPLEQRTIGHLLADKAARNGERTWLVWQERRYSYGDLHRLTNRYANGFASLGIHKGDHVAVMMSNCPEFLLVIWGLGKIGAVAVPLNTAAKGELLRYFITQSESSWLVVGDEWADRIAECAGELGLAGYLHLGNPGALADIAAPVHDLATFATMSDATPPVDRVAFNDPHFIMYTSGTTGPSKGVVSPHSQAHAVGRHLVHHFGYRADDVLYTCLPLFHGNALWYSCYPALWADATLAIAPRFSASGFWDDIRRVGATQFNALGAMINMLLKLPAGAADRQHKVGQCMMLPLTRETYREFADRFGVKITSLYAMTETFPVTMFTPDDPAEKRSSAGKPRGYADVQIIDDEDRPLPPDQLGEIVVRPREPWIMMLGYYKMPEATVRESRNLWFHTGDRGYLDKDGYLYFVDRKKEAIRRRGENISAFEVEMLIARHPQVLEVAAVPVASEMSEDEVMVFIVPRPGEQPAPEEIIAFCDRNMAYFMVPRFVEFIDALPKTASEKIEKYRLKAWAEERRAALWDREKAGIKLKR
jgi:crotonobetaine/carnitine-CoA ligase